MRHDKTTEQLTKEIVEWIKEWFDLNGPKCNAVIGISGGKDSSVTAALCVKALGKDRVIGVLMPDGDQHDIDSSYKLCEHLGIKYYKINIKDAVESILDGVNRFAKVVPSDQTITNVPPRVRMTMLYALSQSVNGRVVNTSNLSEDLVGYFTRWGDECGDFSPLGKLTVREVVSIGDYLGLPYELTHKTPIDGLNFNEDGSSVTDEQSLGVTYEEIDNYIDGEPVAEDSLKIISEKVKKNAFKLRPMAKYDINLH